MRAGRRLAGLPASGSLRYPLVNDRLTAARKGEGGKRCVRSAHFVGGKQVKGGSGRHGDVFNPNTGEVQAKVAFASKSEVEQAIRTDD